MDKLRLLFLTLVLGLVFYIVPNTQPRDFFPFYDIVMGLKTYVYLALEKFILIVMGYIIASESTKYREALWVFFWLLVIDLIDYFLTYNTAWFKVDWFPVSMNMVKVFVFGFVVARIVIIEKWNK
jgi:hypothetical protein